MFTSVPSVSIQSNSSINGTITSSTYPFLIYPSSIYPSSTVISASALTPTTTFPIPLLPTVASLNSYNPMINQMYPMTNQMYPNQMYPVTNQMYPSVISYPDVNSNEQVRKEITEYFFEKIVNNWLKYHYIELYHMLLVNGDKVSLVKDINQVNTNNKNDSKENSLKYQFLLINYFAKNDIYKLLDKFRKANEINWWDIKHSSDEVRKFIQHKVTKYIKKQIMGLNFA